MADFNIEGVKVPVKSMVFELDINNPPKPLVLLINPETFEIRYVPRVVEVRVRWTDRKKTPYVLQTHHNELDVISASGRSAMYYTSKGLTSQQRERTLGWENIQQLLAIYRNNGMNFNRKPGQRGTNLLESIGRVLMIYDKIIYRGSFDSFNLNEVDTSPFNLEFTFDFRVTKTDDKNSSTPLYNDILVKASRTSYRSITQKFATNLNTTLNQIRT